MGLLLSCSNGCLRNRLEGLQVIARYAKRRYDDDDDDQKMV